MSKENFYAFEVNELNAEVKAVCEEMKAVAEKLAQRFIENHSTHAEAYKQLSSYKWHAPGKEGNVIVEAALEIVKHAAMTKEW